jgi:hypothetical protein
MLALARRNYECLGRIDISGPDPLAQLRQPLTGDPPVVFSRFRPERPGPHIIIDLR